MVTRHRTNTSISAQSTQRPDSRASTTSATSQHDDAKQQMHPSHGSFMNGNPEAALLQYHATMEPQQMPLYDISQHQHHHGHPQAGSFQAPLGYPIQDPAYMPPQDVQYNSQPRNGSVPIQSGTEGHDDKRRKGSAVTATNDRELREMLSRNEGRPLKDVAQEVIQKERTPMAEKTKQLFAMLWLRAVCKPAKTSVPRNRVYSQYATRCGTERVVPLNPASFGKLVRVIFPGIQTRRLGVRGESKYHYVDLALDEAAADGTIPYGNEYYTESRPRSQATNAPQLDFNNIPHMRPDTAAFPTADASFDYPPRPPTPRRVASHGQAFAYPDARGMHPGTAESMTYPHTLRFPSSNLPVFTENESITLPDVRPYLPPKTDLDTADALFALYRTHCTSLIDSIRFCKEKQFFRLYTSFHGTLTVPVQKLFTHPNLSPWIEQCDLVMYRTMVRFVSRLTLQAAPVIVINILSNISANLHAHISKTFASQPPHVLDAKLRPATVFAGLLYRLIRVNQSAHAAANLLTIDQNREQMWREWSSMVNPKRVMEAELPACGFEEVYQLLTSEMRNLLEPLQAPHYNDDPYSFQLNFDENGSFANYLQSHNMQQPGSRNGASAVSTENVLDRWSAFITSLPARFPNASARTLLHCVSVIGTAALRDITIMNGASYGHWWVLKIFVDEMALWLAEMGGFLDPAVDEMVPTPNGSGSMYHSPILHEGSEMHSQNGNTNGGSRGASMGAEAHHAMQHNHNGGMPHHAPDSGMMTYGYPQQYHQHPQGISLPFAPAPHLQQHKPHGGHEMAGGGGDIDDSGIGMELMV
ncbi:uncharacterized protein LTR77_008506 [Saxophila tyrrhenica]|uniref:RFX-type winged-helix domain-containing protein n=1 Tax=Saxophila tyrrhenica TaxID=1690608 RepID=A0AAV9P3Z5_9PEZI|nr:hypothetical protein LTR77_008506 [Saxophila tyrrhenica]